MAHVYNTRHLRSLTAPNTWPIERKKFYWIKKPSPSTYPIHLGMPILIWLRDYLKIAKNKREVKYLLNNKKVLINWRVRRDLGFQVGLFDVISIPEIGKHYRVIIDERGKLGLREISEEESKIKIVRIIRKTMINNGKIQVTGFDGSNYIVDNSIKTGDSLVVSLPDLEIRDILKMEEGNQIFIFYGSKVGKIGILKEVRILRKPFGHTRFVKYINIDSKEEEETVWDYTVVIGKDKPIITIR